MNISSVWFTKMMWEADLNLFIQIGESISEEGKLQFCSLAVY
jgi:hypothetical protein